MCVYINVVCLCIFVYICVYVCIYTYICLYAYTYIRIYIHMYLYMCVQPGAAGCRASDVDPPPPSRRAGCQRRVRSSLGLLRTPKPQTDPALSADPARHDSHFWPSDPKWLIFGWLFADRKFIKNRTPQKPAQNLKNWTPDRPEVDFGMTFGIHLATIFN